MIRWLVTLLQGGTEPQRSCLTGCTTVKLVSYFYAMPTMLTKLTILTIPYPAYLPYSPYSPYSPYLPYPPYSPYRPYHTDHTHHTHHTHWIPTILTILTIPTIPTILTLHSSLHPALTQLLAVKLAELTSTLLPYIVHVLYTVHLCQITLIVHW